MKKLLMALTIAVGMAFLPACTVVRQVFYPTEFVQTQEAETVKIDFRAKMAYINIGYMKGDLFGRQMDIVDGFGIKELRLTINCGGGALFEMFSMVDRIQRFQDRGGNVVSIAQGIVASAAVPIFVIADLRISGRHTVFMIHPHSMWGQIDEDGKYFDKKILDHPSYKTLYKKMGNLWNVWYANWISSRSYFTYDDIIEMMTTENASNGQWWFTAPEFWDKGAVDIIK